MDIYGYAGYPYNQSDELAKQMFAQQALAVPFNRGTQEPHVMPAPSGSPWNVQGLPWGMSSPPQLVQFTGQHLALEQKISPVIHCKRKSLDVEPVIPAKQLITEEKMAAHLNSLHISSEYTPHTLANTNEGMDVGMEPVTEKLKGHTIVLSEELKKLQEEPLLPAALIDRFEKPRMSLVVWKPRENILEKLKEDDKELEKDEPQRRNGVLATSHQSSTVLEDIDM
ncbi:unnamed protein product [Chrysodeixis includens]|uniref:Uncharacterized protein n=1 Tax=Chrysodeixis includens TaxID=689277 RepID=A0A9N8Q2H1_CHRIL|nr:unnamed protein product [Chrysodeixis includens]